MKSARKLKPDQETAMNTRDNLQNAIIAESKAHVRYIASKMVAEREGKYQAARLFKALAEAEVIHAVNHINVLGEMGTTNINIESAIAFEKFEHLNMYPAFVEQAELDGNRLAILSFRGAMAGEAAHSKLLEKLKVEIDSDIDAPYYVCPKCGDIELETAPLECPVCGLENNGFLEII
jgi:rubrerythrin